MLLIEIIFLITLFVEVRLFVKSSPPF
jgi:hypothetical protein